MAVGNYVHEGELSASRSGPYFNRKGLPNAVLIHIQFVHKDRLDMA
jgi:hypothetical protein